MARYFDNDAHGKLNRTLFARAGRTASWLYMMSIGALLLVGLPSRQTAPQVPFMRAHLILEGASSPRAACLPRYSFDKVGRAHLQDSRLVALSAPSRCASVPHTSPAPAARQRSVDPPHPLPGRCLVMPRDFAARAPLVKPAIQTERRRRSWLAACRHGSDRAQTISHPCSCVACARVVCFVSCSLSS